MTVFKEGPFIDYLTASMLNVIDGQSSRISKLKSTPAMTTDIDRQKLRELCERTTPGPWVPLKNWPDRIVPATHVARSPGASASEDEDRDIYALVICRAEHNDYSGFAHEIQESEAIANASFIAASRTALPALLDLTDAQAAKIAELEAENARRSAELDERRTECRLANKIATQERRANAAAQVLIASLESERDQLRKQVEGPSIILSPAEIQSGLDRVRWAELLICQLPANHDGRNSWLLNYGSSTASALEQKEQG